MGTQWDRHSWCWQMGGKQGGFLQIWGDMVNKWGEDSQQRQGGGYKGGRGAKVLLKDTEMSDSEDHLLVCGLFLSQYHCVSKGKIWIWNPAGEKVTAVKTQKLLNDIQGSWKTLFSSYFSPCNSCNCTEYSFTSICIKHTAWDESHEENLSESLITAWKGYQMPHYSAVYKTNTVSWFKRSDPVQEVVWKLKCEFAGRTPV